MQTPSTNRLFGSSSTPIAPTTAATEEGYDALTMPVEISPKRLKYEDFTTIDWIHDLSTERTRLKKIKHLKGFSGFLYQSFDASQAWITVLMVGVSSGVLAAFIDGASEFLNDLKIGYCSEAWYLNQKFCCWQEMKEECLAWRYWSNSETIWGYLLNYILYILLSILFASTSAYLVKRFAPYASGSGIPEVKTILSGFIIRKFLGIATLVIKSIGLSLSVASGLCLGKEGPLVHVACCCGNIFPRLFDKYAKNEAKKREILSASASAGVSVAFGAPIGGVLFSLEEVSYYFPYKTLWRSFFCAMIAAVTLQLLNPFRTNKLVLFQVTYDRPWHTFELLFFILLGILGGLLGALFIRYNLKVNAKRRQHEVRNWPILETVVVVLLTSSIGYLNVFSRVNMSELVSQLFSECENSHFYGLCNPDQRSVVIGSLLWVAVLKFILTIFTFGIRVPAGIFIPSMTVGACIGRVVGILVQSLQEAHPDWSFFSACLPNKQCITPGTYAMLGAAGTLAGVTRMSVSLVVIMFELTGTLTYVLPIMLTVMVAKWVAEVFESEGIYDGLIRLGKYPFLDDKKEFLDQTLTRDIMTRKEDLSVITSQSQTMAELSSLLKETSHKGFPIVDNLVSFQLLGFIGRSELQFALEEAKQRLDPVTTICYFQPYHLKPNVDPGLLVSPIVQLHPLRDESLPLQESSPSESKFLDCRPWMEEAPLHFSPRMPVETLLDLFRKMGLRYALVVEHGQLEGILTKKDLLNYLEEREREELRK